MADDTLVEMKVTGVHRSPHANSGNSYAVILADAEGTCQVLLWVREPQAQAVATALGHPQADSGSSRPAPGGRLPLKVATWLGMAVKRVVITEWGSEPRARIESIWAGRKFEIMAGAAVAIELASRSNAPVYFYKETLGRIAHRQRLDEQSRQQGVKDERVLAVMAAVPREKFLPDEMRFWARIDSALPIGEKQFISQPSLVARMTELLNPGPQDRILEIGGGSGYQAAILSRLAGHVYTIDILPTLIQSAEERLAGLGYPNITFRQGDGYQGWPEEAPFDGIMVTCATPHIPEPLVKQLKEGGRMVLPVREAHGHEDLTLVTKLPGGKVERRKITDVWFVPMTGAHGMPSSQTAPFPPEGGERP